MQPAGVHGTSPPSTPLASRPTLIGWNPSTSLSGATDSMIRRLGGKRWLALHRLIYVSAMAGVVHYWWLVKADVSSPQRYSLIVGGLLLFRLMWARFRNAAPAGARPQTLTRSNP